MLFRKTLVRATVLALLAAPVSVAVAAETTGAASAATTLSTTTTIEIYNQRNIEYGSGGTALIEGAVKASDGTAVDYSNGTMALQAHAYGSSTWTTIYTQDPSLYFSYTVKPTISTQYRIVYTPDPTVTDSSYTGSTSATVTQGVARKLSIQHRGLRMWGKVSPAKSRLKIVFKILKHHHLRPWFTVRTDKHGKWSKHISGRVGTKFAVIVPTSGGYVGTHEEYSII